MTALVLVCWMFILGLAGFGAGRIRTTWLSYTMFVLAIASAVVVGRALEGQWVAGQITDEAVFWLDEFDARSRSK